MIFGWICDQFKIQQLTMAWPFGIRKEEPIWEVKTQLNLRIII